MKLASVARKLLWPSATLVVLVLAAGFLYWYTSPNNMGKRAFAATELPTRTLEEARALAQRDGKPILLNFSAYWCPSCRKLDREVFVEDDIVQQLEAHFVYVRVNSSEPGARELMKQYGVYGYPTLLVTDAGGKLLGKLPVAYDPQSFQQYLNAVTGSI